MHEPLLRNMVRLLSVRLCATNDNLRSITHLARGSPVVAVAHRECQRFRCKQRLVRLHCRYDVILPVDTKFDPVRDGESRVTSRLLHRANHVASQSLRRQFGRNGRVQDDETGIARKRGGRAGIL